MKGTVTGKLRFLAAVTALASLLSFFTVFGDSYNDERFEVYSNMNSNRSGALYIVPNLYRQDAAYPYVKTFPLVVSGGVEYVPISMFSLYSYITVTYSKISDNFYIQNTKTNEYLAFDVTRGIAEMSGGKTMEMETRIYHRTRYIPARAVAQQMGLTCEAYDDTKRGIYAFRISDSNAAFSFSELLRQYLPSSHLPENNPPEQTDPPEITPETKPEVQPEVQPEKDPVLSVAQRQVCMMYELTCKDAAHNPADVLTNNGIRAGFSMSRDFILANTSSVRKMTVRGHALSVTLSAAETDSLTEENAKDALIDYLENANDALFAVTHRKTRICTVNDKIKQLFSSAEELENILSENGYVLFDETVGADYSKSAYSIHTELSGAVVNAFPENQRGLVKMIIPCSEKSRNIASNLSAFINKYPNFTALPANETMA